MSLFIKLHSPGEPSPMRFNFEVVLAYGAHDVHHQSFENDAARTTRVVTIEGTSFFVLETPEQIDQLIAEACAEEGR